jgi:phospholipase/carboxylesterase
MPLLDGPRLAPQAGTPARGLVVLLHGYGADGSDLIDIARAVAPVLPEIAFVAPDAPDRLPGTPFGRQWFPLERREPAERKRGVEAARPVLDAFLDAEQARLGLGGDRTVLVGFSQGTMVALHVGLRREVAAIVGFSGLLVAPEDLTAITHRPPVTLIHGDADPVVPFPAMRHAAEALAAAGVPVTAHARPGLGHGIDPAGLEIALAAIRRSLES